MEGGGCRLSIPRAVYGDIKVSPSDNAETTIIKQLCENFDSLLQEDLGFTKVLPDYVSNSSSPTLSTTEATKFRFVPTEKMKILRSCR